MKTYYAIEIIGYGQKRVYCIKKVIKGDGTFNPFTGNIFRTEEAARSAAKSRGIKIEKIGDYYQII